eukprot:TRINITY_DN15307_c0_g1_i1.p1 TRINITY_DN15307_c0_g1~~TRINITY_DN15307_c0_g1_i1.p1  ORF type:complete len:733 (+),score=301.88 TRINITY_DN15307_c0_g1_i1:142-2340(+)
MSTKEYNTIPDGEAGAVPTGGNKAAKPTDGKNPQDKLSIHTSVALLCAPVLILAVVASAVLLNLNQSHLSDFDSTASNYASLSGKMIRSLEVEKDVLIKHVLSDLSYEAGLKEAQENVTKVVNEFASYHYRVTTEGDSGGKVGVSQYKVFVAALRQDDLAAMRSLAREYHNTKKLDTVERIGRVYGAVAESVLVMGGRQSAMMSEPFSRGNLALVGHLQRLSALSDTQFASLWYEHAAQSQAERTASLRAAVQGVEDLAMAGAFADAYAQDTLVGRPHGQQPAAYYERLSGVGSSLQEVYAVDLNVFAEQDGTTCRRVREDMYEGSDDIHAAVDDAVEEKRDTLVVTMAALITLIIICVIGLGMHGLNVQSYKNSYPLVHQAQKELVKLKKCLAKMEKYANTCLTEELDEAELHARIKQKGVPPAEKTLIGTMSRIQQIKGYIPPAVFSEEFMTDNQPFLKAGVKVKENVVVLCCDLGQLNAVTPVDKPFKLKAMEKSKAVFLSRMIQTSEAKGGSLVDLTSDYAIIMFNFLRPRAKPQFDACLTALEIAEKIDPESDGVKPSFGIVSANLVAGNAGMKTLMTFVTVGAGIGRAKHVQNLSMFYDLPILMDNTTQELAMAAKESSKESVQTEFKTYPVDFVRFDEADASAVQIHKLVGGSRGNADDDRAERSEMFQKYSDGNIDEAKKSCNAFVNACGKTTRIVDRFKHLCDKYPNVPIRDKHDLLDAMETA